MFTESIQQLTNELKLERDANTSQSTVVRLSVNYKSPADTYNAYVLTVDVEKEDSDGLHMRAQMQDASQQVKIAEASAIVRT